MYARGAIFGLTRDTGINHITKATLDSLAYQTKDVLCAMENDSNIQLKNLQVDGGACANNYLMQFQANILGTNVDRPQITESTALGAAYLAGISCGLWSKSDVAKKRKIETTFEPSFEQEKIDKMYDKWKDAVRRSMNWIKE